MRKSDKRIKELTTAEAVHSSNLAGEIIGGLIIDNNINNPSEEVNVKKSEKNKKKTVKLEDAVRYFPETNEGLSTSQVAQRIEDGLVNISKSRKGKSYWQIILGNICTFFNLIYVIVAAALLSFGMWTDVVFLTVIIANTGIAIIQEIKSKQAIDKLNLVAAPTAVVIRNGITVSIPVREVVLDDIIQYTTGKQICSDGILIEGHVEVNEAMLSGESIAVIKKKGDTLFAGSYVTSGTCFVRVDKIGTYNYIDGLTSRASVYKKPASELLRSLKWVLRIIAIIIIPLAIFSYFNNLNIVGRTWPDLSEYDIMVEAIRKTAATVIGIIPAGPFLLTSFALAVSVIRLAYKNTLVQELYCIEMLARVDTLCLDKTGTLTDGTMHVVESIDLRSGTDNKYLIKDILGSMLSALEDNNLTSIALYSYFGTNSKFKKTAILPFSSKRKFCAVSFEEDGTYFLGAPEFVLNAPSAKVDALVKRYTQQGLRVVLLAHSVTELNKNDTAASKLPLSRKPLALIAIEDHIRDDAPQTIKWFKDNDVAVKIISGDNPITVSEIAHRVGVENANRFISLEGLSDDQVVEAATKYTVFGRVSPDQKAILVRAMKNAGHTVAMTGDGVNDILALREADCSIAMASGMDAARNVSHLVLMDNNFSNLPKVVAEGRRVVNNIQLASSMYFMKTLYTIIISVLVLLMNKAFPFNATQILLMEILIVGAPTTILALQKNSNIIKGSFLWNVFRRSIPVTITFLLGTIALYVFAEIYPESFATNGNRDLETMVALTVTFTSIFALYWVCKPFNYLRGILFGSSIILVFIALFILQSFNINGQLVYADLSLIQILLVLTITFVSFPLLLLLRRLFYSVKMV